MLNVCLVIYFCLIYFKKVHKRICFKKYYFVKQSLCGLKTKKAKMAKMGFNPTVVETAYILIIEFLSLTAHLLPLTNLFAFNLSFF